MRLLIILLCISQISFSQIDQKPITYKVGAGLNYNIHSAAFKELPGYSYCCGELNQGAGISYYANIGVVYNNKSPLFGIIESYNLDLVVNNYSADLIKDTLIGYDIQEFDYSLINAEHIQESSLLYLGLRPSINLKLIKDLKMNLGIGLSFPLFGEFNYYERSKGGINFINGTDTINSKSGQIPDLNPILISPSLGLSYDFKLNHTWNASFDINYTYNLNDFVSGINWNSSAISAGISIYMNTFEKGVSQPPIPDLPKVEEPKKEIALKPVIKVIYQDRELKKGEELDIRLYSESEIEEYSILPVLFYKRDSDQLREIPQKEGIEYLGQENLIPTIALYLQENPNVKVNIIATSSSNESSGISEKRMSMVKETLYRNGVNPDKISQNFIYINKNDSKYDELDEENEKIEFEFSDKNNLVSFRLNEKNKYEFVSNQNLVVRLKSNYDRFNTDSYIKVNQKNINFTKELEFKQALNSTYLNAKEGIDDFAIYSTFEANGQTIDEQFNIRLNKKVINKKEILNQFSDDNGKGSQLILGYFDFDKAVFKAIDYKALEAVKDAIQNNKRVEILPLTDNLGSSLHNQRLAARRAKAAAKLIGENNFVKVKIPENSLFSNDHPYGRILNRSVIVKIYE